MFGLRTNGNREEGIIIAFKNQPATQPKKLKKFCKKLYGYRDYSNKGGYTYERKGLLDEIPHILINPIRSVIVVREEDAKTILDFLQEFGAEVYARRVTLEKEDLERLEGSGSEKEERKRV